MPWAVDLAYAAAALAAVALRGSVAQSSRDAFVAVCEAPDCTVAGGACADASTCCGIGIGQFCDPARGVYTPCGCGDPVPITPAPEGCPCETSDDCEGDFECATSGITANTCQVRRRCSFMTAPIMVLGRSMSALRRWLRLASHKRCGSRAACMQWRF